jgi:hypothetical protein
LYLSLRFSSSKLNRDLSDRAPGTSTHNGDGEGPLAHCANGYTGQDGTKKSIFFETTSSFGRQAEDFRELLLDGG